jgi:hypothetical protein
VLVSVLGGFLTEIRTFYSLKEIREGIEEEISQYKLLFEDYSQWLGSLLRNPENLKNQDFVKKASELQKVLKTGGKGKGKREEKKSGISTEWVQFKDVMLCSDSIGEVELLFDAAEELKNKIDRLEKVKNSIVDLERYGLGKELLYVTYIRDGVPEKIVFKQKKSAETTQKFGFTADFSVITQT